MSRPYLVDAACDGWVEDAGDQQVLHVAGLDVELARDETNLYAGVGSYQLDQNLQKKSWVHELY